MENLSKAESATVLVYKDMLLFCLKQPTFFKKICIKIQCRDPSKHLSCPVSPIISPLRSPIFTKNMHKEGNLKIVLVDRSKDIVSEANAANLDRKEIMDFTMEFKRTSIEDEMVLENLKPGADLEYPCIKNYGGKRLPS
ncbi:uncharacterized protein LOC141643282 [Silene latifolia]|uniref:uncharacterized protein LOC141643282 n=1 Tax=Silene latifolia TaxID=37657 RepID=UPI003D77BC56